MIIKECVTGGIMNRRKFIKNSGIGAVGLINLLAWQERAMAWGIAFLSNIPAVSGNKAIFGYGVTAANVSMTNLVSNTGVVSADVTGVGTARYRLAAASYG